MKTKDLLSVADLSAAEIEKNISSSAENEAWDNAEVAIW